MFKKILKWLGILLGALIILLIIALSAGYFRVQSMMNKTFAVPLEAISAANDPALVARGEVLVNVMLCVQCHGRKLDGQNVPFEPLSAEACAEATFRYCPPNLTTGEGGIASHYSDAEIERAVRHGVRQDGTSVVSAMPSVEYNTILSDDEMGAIIAYLRYAAEPVDSVRQESSNPIFLGIAGLGLIGPLSEEFAAAHIDHAQPHPAARPVEIGPTAVYGQYLHKISCSVCHEKGAGELPDGTVIPENLLVAGAYSEAEFFTLLREARARDGRQLHRLMEPYGILPDEEIAALYLFLQSAANEQQP